MWLYLEVKPERTLTDHSKRPTHLTNFLFRVQWRMADPGKTIRGALNLRFSPFVGGGEVAAATHRVKVPLIPFAPSNPPESSWSQLSESEFLFSIRGAHRGRPFIDPPLRVYPCQCSKLINIVTRYLWKLSTRMKSRLPKIICPNWNLFIETICKKWILTVFYKNGCISLNNGPIWKNKFWHTLPNKTVLQGGLDPISVRPHTFLSVSGRRTGIILNNALATINIIIDTHWLKLI